MLLKANAFNLDSPLVQAGEYNLNLLCIGTYSRVYVLSCLVYYIIYHFKLGGGYVFRLHIYMLCKLFDVAAMFTHIVVIQTKVVVSVSSITCMVI